MFGGDAPVSERQLRSAEFVLLRQIIRCRQVVQIVRPKAVVQLHLHIVSHRLQRQFFLALVVVHVAIFVRRGAGTRARTITDTIVRVLTVVVLRRKLMPNQLLGVSAHHRILGIGADLK